MTFRPKSILARISGIQSLAMLTITSSIFKPLLNNYRQESERPRKLAGWIESRESNELTSGDLAIRIITEGAIVVAAFQNPPAPGHGPGARGHRCKRRQHAPLDPAPWNSTSRRYLVSAITMNCFRRPSWMRSWQHGQ